MGYRCQTSEGFQHYSRSPSLSFKKYSDSSRRGSWLEEPLKLRLPISLGSTQIHTNRLIRANRFSGPRFGAPKIANRRFEA